MKNGDSVGLDTHQMREHGSPDTACAKNLYLLCHREIYFQLLYLPVHLGAMFFIARYKLKQVLGSYFRFRFPSTLFRLLTPHVSIHQSESVHYKLRMQGRDSSVGIATRYGLDGPGIESRWGRDFPHPSRPALGPTQPPIQWVPGLFPGGKAAGAWR